MSLELILSQILALAQKQKEGIIQEARQQAHQLIQQAKQESGKLTEQFLAAEKKLAQAKREKLLVQSRLEAKKNLLETKQELIAAVIEGLRDQVNKAKLKKKQIFPDKVQDASTDADFYLKKIRLDYENEIAKILFD